MSMTVDPAASAPVTFPAQFGSVLPYKDGRHVVQIIAYGQTVGMLTADEPATREQIKQIGDSVGVMTLFPVADIGELQAVWKLGDKRLAWVVRP